MKKSRLLGAVCAVLFTVITVSANAALIGRLPATPGGTDFQAAYDTVLDITWTTDASLSGNFNWDNQVAWADSLVYLGFDDWRLASMSVAAGLPTGTATSLIDCNFATELACRDNEVGYMFYQNLGGSLSDDLTGDHTLGDVTLTNIQPIHWSGTEFAFGGPLYFLFNVGIQLADLRLRNDGYGWAVRSGDVAPSPPPDADGDGVNDNEDLCPDTAPDAAVDAVGCSDVQVDSDGDGICNDGAVSNGPSACVGVDACSGTVIPEGVPTIKLGTNRWALVDDDFEFDTTAPKGKGPGRSYSTADTAGCTCEQIITALDLGKGHTKHGCSISTMDEWVALPR